MTLSFFLLRVLPGSPFDLEASLDPTVKQYWEEKVGLHQSIISQYSSYLANIAQGDWGNSWSHPDQKVTELIAAPMRVSFVLGAFAFIVALIGGVGIGYVFAFFVRTKNQSFISIFSDVILSAMTSLPSLLVGPLFAYWLAVRLQWFPVALLQGPKSYILPVLTLALRPMGLFAQIFQETLLENSDADFVRTAYAKGVSRWRTHILHKGRFAFSRLLGSTPTILTGLLSGSVVVESVFAVPGLGTQFMESLNSRDLPQTMILTLIYAVVLLSAGLAAEALIQWADPRVRY